MVYVVYGNPPNEVRHWDHDGDETAMPRRSLMRIRRRYHSSPTATKPSVTTMYDGKTGSVPNAGHLTTEFVALLTRHGVSTTAMLM